jgi:hypothetical protein
MPTFVWAGVAPLSRSTRAALGNGVFVECDRHRYETGFRIPGGVRRKRTRWHEPFGFERQNAKGDRNPHARWRAGSSVRGAGDLPQKL